MGLIPIKDSLYFTYDSEDCRDYGLILVNYNVSPMEEYFAPEQEIYSVEIRGKSEPYFQGTKRLPLQIDIEFAFDQQWTDEQIAGISRLLFTDYYKELVFSDMPDKVFFAQYIGDPLLLHNCNNEGLIQITMRTLDPYAYSELIESEYRFLTPSSSFSRPSLAYNPDTGAEVPADTPIYVEFAEGRLGSLMCEGVKQELANAALEWDGATLPGWMMPGSSGMSYAGYNIGEARVIAGTAGGGTKRVGIYQEAVVSENDVVTLQCLVRKTGLVDGIRLEIGWRYSDGSFLAYDYLNIALLLTSEFQLFTFSAVAPAGTGRVHLRPIWDSMQRTNCEIEAYMPMAQINGTEYALPWHKEGTRANPVKQITLPQALPQEFGIGVTIKPLWDSSSENDIYRRGFNVRGAGSDDYFALIFNPVSKRWYVVMRIGGNNLYSYLPATEFNAGDIIGLYSEYRASRFRLAAKFAGGEIVFSNWVTDNRQLPNFTEIYVGSRYDGTASANAVFADFVLHDNVADIDPEGFLNSVPGGA